MRPYGVRHCVTEMDYCHFITCCASGEASIDVGDVFWGREYFRMDKPVGLSLRQGSYLVDNIKWRQNSATIIRAFSFTCCFRILRRITKDINDHDFQSCRSERLCCSVLSQFTCMESLLCDCVDCHGTVY